MTRTCVQLLKILPVLATLLIVSAHGCQLAVVGGGAPRTGSTHQVHLARIALQELGVGELVVDGGYWNWPKHAFLNETEVDIYKKAEQVSRSRLSL